jgi:uncharacterized protein YaiL (DUF2058 family)
MFDLKAKLLAQGLVSKEHINKIEREKKAALHKNPKRGHDFVDKDRQKALRQLLAASKSEQYNMIRKWVDINRLDKAELVSLDSEKFFINTKDEQVSWLSLHKDIVALIAQGKAGVIAYMSNHGLAHAVVPRDIAEDVGQAFPDWLKVLNEEST